MTHAAKARPWWRRPSILVGLTAVLVMGIGLRAAYLVEHLEKSPTLHHALGEAGEHRDLARQVSHGYVAGPEHLAAEPLYPLALGGLFLVMGESPSRLAAAQALLGLGILVLVFLLGLWVASAEVGVMAAGLLALYGPLLHFEGEALPVTLALALHLVALIAVVSATARPRPLRAGLAGALLGLLAWARPWLLLVPLLRALGALPDLVRTLRSRSTSPRSATPPRFAGRLVLAGFLTLGLAVLLTPLYLRNARSGAPGSLLPARYGLQLYVANHPGATGEDVPPPGFTAPRRHLFDEARQRSSGDLQRMSGDLQRSSGDLQRMSGDLQRSSGEPRRPLATPAQTSRHHVVLALRATLAAPGESLGRLGRKALYFAHAEELPASTRIAARGERQLSLRLASLPFSLLLGLGLVGLVFAGLRGRAWLWASLGAHFLYALVMPASSEARITLAPVLAVAAAAALLHLARHASRRPRALIAGLLALALGLALAFIPLPGGPRRVAEARLDTARALLAQGRPWAAQEALGPLRGIPGSRASSSRASASRASASRASAARPSAARPSTTRASTTRPAAQTDAQADPRASAQADTQNAQREEAAQLEGLACQQLGRHREALDHLHRALARSPRRASAHVDIAHSYAVLADRAAARGDRGEGADRLHEALSHLDKALVLQPANLKGLLLAAQLHRAMGRKDRTQALLDRALALAPASPEVHQEIGIFAALSGDLVLARAHFALARLLGAHVPPPWDSVTAPGKAPAGRRHPPGPSPGGTGN